MIKTVRINLDDCCNTCKNYGWNGHRIKTCKKGIIRLSSIVFPSCNEFIGY